jgi:hypothetical protein
MDVVKMICLNNALCCRQGPSRSKGGAERFRLYIERRRVECSKRIERLDTRCADRSKIDVCDVHQMAAKN